jgi:hypothetical protein
MPQPIERRLKNATPIVVEIQIVENKRLLPLEVLKKSDGSYEVQVDGKVRHAGCSAEDVMRALGNYLHAAGFSAAKEWSTKPRG